MSAGDALARLRAKSTSKSNRAALGELEAWLAASTPSAEAWDSVCAIAGRFGKPAHEQLIDLLAERLAAWPDDLRVMPPAWWEAWTSKQKSKQHPLARLARLRLLAHSGAWFEGELSGDGGAVQAVWGAPGGDAFVQATAMDPHRAGGELSMLTADGRQGMTLAQSSSDYGQGLDTCFSRDGKRLATVYAGARLVVTLWETRTAKPHWTQEIGPENEVLYESMASVAVDAKANRVAVLHAALGGVQVLSGGRKKVAALPTGPKLDAFAFVGDGARLATAAGNALTVWDVANGKPVQQIGLPIAVAALIAADDATLAGIGPGGCCALRDTPSGLEVDAASVRTWPPPAGRTAAVDLHPVLGAIASRADCTALTLVERGETRAFAGEHICLTPMPGGREWISIALVPGAAVVPDDEDEDEDEDAVAAQFRAGRDPDGGVYLWSPDGDWSRPAGKLRLVLNPLDEVCSQYTSLSELLDHEHWKKNILEIVTYALDAGKFPLDVEERATWSYFHYPLHNAAELCSETKDEAAPIWSVFDLLLARDPDPKRMDRDGRDALTALFHNLNGHSWGDGPPRGRLEDVVFKLLAAGVDPWAVPQSGVVMMRTNIEQEVAARCLARLGLRRCVAALAEVRPALLQEAALRGHWEVFDDVRARGVGIDERGPDGNAPLHWTALDKNPALTRELLRRGADPDVAIDEREARYLGFTALHLAAFRDHAEVAAALVESRARVDARAARGWTPAHVAAEWGKLATLQVLVRGGADVDAKTDDGHSVVDVVGDPARKPAYPFKGEYSDWTPERSRTRDWLARLAEARAAGPAGAEQEATLLGNLAALGGIDAFRAAYEQGTRRFPDLDMRGFVIDGATFADLVLERANVAGVSAGRSHWSRCQLALTGQAYFNSAELDDCTFASWDAGNTDLSGATFRRCTFAAPIFSACDMGRTAFVECELRDAALPGGGQHRRGIERDLQFSGSKLARCRFGPQMTLEEASFEESALETCTFATVRFERCDFRKATLLGVDFSTAAFEACKLEGAVYDGACKFPAGFDPAAEKMVLR